MHSSLNHVARMIATSYPSWFSSLVQFLMLLIAIGPLILAIAVSGYGIKAVRNRSHSAMWICGIIVAWLMVLLNQVFIVPAIPR